jgi:hypothetical protein
MIIIDRFEKNLAVVEYQGKTYNIPKEWLPTAAKEGNVVIFTASVDEQETARRRKEIEAKLEDLFK